jgi:hypothetical protein
MWCGCLALKETNLTSDAGYFKVSILDPVHCCMMMKHDKTQTHYFGKNTHVEPY